MSIEECENYYVKNFFHQSSSPEHVELRKTFLSNFKMEKCKYSHFQLQTIVLTTTIKEINEGHVYIFFKNFFGSYPLLSKQTCTELISKHINSDNNQSFPQFDFFIVTNKDLASQQKKEIVEKFRSIIRSKQTFSEEVTVLLKLFRIHFLSCQLNDIEDQYIRENFVLPGINIPTYGYRSGPNIMFYKILNYFSTYYQKNAKETNDVEIGNAIFCVETDCYPVQDHFFEEMQQLVKLHPSSYIIGSYYKGLSQMSKFITNHLNGVAIYFVENTNFIQLLQYIESYHKLIVKSCPYVAYDCVFEYFLYSLLYTENDHWKQKENLLIRLIRSYMINTNKIINVSTNHDTHLKEHFIKCIYPDACILHKKDFQNHATEDSKHV